MRIPINSIQILSSPIIRRLTYAQQGIWFAFLLRVKHEPDLAWTVDQLARELRVHKTRQARFNKDLATLLDAGLIVEEADGITIPLDWR